MGFPGAAALLPHLVLGLPAGVWVDRMPYRRVLVLTAYGRLFARDVRPALESLTQSRNQSTSHAP